MGRLHKLHCLTLNSLVVSKIWWISEDQPSKMSFRQSALILGFSFFSPFLTGLAEMHAKHYFHLHWLVYYATLYFSITFKNSFNTMTIWIFDAPSNTIPIFYHTLWQCIQVHLLEIKLINYTCERKVIVQCRVFKLNLAHHSIQILSLILFSLSQVIV